MYQAMPFDFDRDFVRPTAAVVVEIEGGVGIRIMTDERPEDPSKRKTAWERVLEDHPVFDRPWWKPSLPRVPAFKDVCPTFYAWAERVRRWRSR